MLEDTIKKIREEQEKGAGEKKIGEYLLEHLNKRPEDEVFIAAEGKSIEGCMKHLKDIYIKQARNGVAVAADEEVYTHVRAYYGLPEEKKIAGISLDDLL